MAAYDERATIANCLRGQTIRFPAPEQFFAKWPRLVHPRLADLRAHVEQTIREVYSAHPKVSKLILADFGFFGATWWPCASYKRLQVVTELSIWLFVWDDEIDSVLGEFATSLRKAQAFRRATLDYVTTSLGLYEPDRLLITDNAIIRAFDTFGHRLRTQCPFPQRIGLLREIEYFMMKSEIEQRHALNGRIVSLNEYWSFRMGTSAVRVALAVNEYTCNLSLPNRIINHPDMRTIWNCCNGIISIVNDIFSARKELAEDAVDSLLPIAYAVTGSAQDSADAATYLVEHYADIFDQASNRLLSSCEGDPGLSRDLQSLLLGCRYYCSGNLEWSLATPRYKAATRIHKNAMYITL